VHVFENTENLSTIKAGSLEIEISLRSMVGEKITTLEELSYKVDVPVILHETKVLHNEWMMDNF